jgi:hypothetical protein
LQGLSLSLPKRLLRAVSMQCFDDIALPPNKQLQRTVQPRRGRAASASFHCALAARSIGQRAAAELRRYAA